MHCQLFNTLAALLERHCSPAHVRRLCEHISKHACQLAEHDTEAFALAMVNSGEAFRLTDACSIAIMVCIEVAYSYQKKSKSQSALNNSTQVEAATRITSILCDILHTISLNDVTDCDIAW